MQVWLQAVLINFHLLIYLAQVSPLITSSPQDTVILVNLWDEPRCWAPWMCPAPLMSFFKQWDWAAERGIQNDILIPAFNHLYGV